MMSVAEYRAKAAAADTLAKEAVIFEVRTAWEHISAQWALLAQMAEVQDGAQDAVEGPGQG